MKRKVFIISIFLLLILGITINSYQNKTVYKIKLEKVTKIDFVSNEKLTSIDNLEDIKIIMAIITKETKKKSVQDAPTNYEECFRINVINEEKTSIFAYKKRNKYFLEQPYNGIYEITESEYKTLKSML